MAITLQFQLTGLDSRITNFNVYRRRAVDQFVRLTQINVQLQYTDLTGQAGDQYYYTFFDNVRFLESGPSPIIIASQNLDSITITGYVIGCDTNPTCKDIEITVSLQTTSLNTPIFDGQIIADLKQVVATNDTGKFVFEIAPNDLIYPGRTYYKIGYLDKLFFKEVSSKQGQAQLFTALLDVNPKELR